MLIDSHCHLTFEALATHLDDVLLRAAEANVTEMVHIATSDADAQRADSLLADRAEVHIACGLHPHEAAHHERELPLLAERLKRGLVGGRSPVAVGETGLDFHYDFAPRDQQESAFRAQIELALQHDLPLVIHARAAEDEAREILDEYSALNGRAVFHCYSGSVESAQRIIERGYWISLTGMVTFKKALEVQEVARLVPIDRLMVETDAPYLSPEPHRNVRPNEPALVAHTARFIAQLRGVSFAELAVATTANARRFYSLSES